MKDKLLNIREVAERLGITEREVIDLAEEGKIPAYKIGGLYLRFKPEHIREAKKKLVKSVRHKDKIGFIDKIHDFFYFNDFYILSFLIIVLMIIIILQT